MSIMAKIHQYENPDYAAIMARQCEIWSVDEESKIGGQLQLVGEELAEAIDLPPGQRVLDIAFGNGNATLALAKRWQNVTSIDCIDRHLKNSIKRSKAEGIDIDYQLADTEELPFETNSFDAVISTFGVMFFPNQKVIVRELCRVCKPGGKIAFTSWTPNSFVGCLLKLIRRYSPPPLGVRSPMLWGCRDWVDETFSRQTLFMNFGLKKFMFRYHTPEAFIDYFRRNYGPVYDAYEKLTNEQQLQLSKELLALIDEFNSAVDGSMRVASEYAEIIITKAHD